MDNTRKGDLILREVTGPDGEARPPAPPRLEPPLSPAPSQGQDVKAAQPVAKPKPRRLALKFTGSAGEYFRIWIVNIVLTILTVGIYGAWAKVRTRRYFYANTLLDGHPFDYMARPVTILKGYLIVGGAITVMKISGRFLPLVGFLISAVAWSLVPLLLYKAHRFKAKTAVYRNIRFRFLGTPMGAYKTYAFIPIGVVLSLVIALPMLLGAKSGLEPGAAPNIMVVVIAGLSGLLYTAAFPYFAFLQRRYLHENLAYGKTGSTFRGGARRFYGIYLKAFFMMLGVGILGGVLTAILMPLIVGLTGAGKEAVKTWAFGAGLIFPLVFGSLFLLVQQYVYARTFNYAWGNTRIGPITVNASLEAKALAWIRLTNVLAIVLSLGFLAPWAKVRRARYILPRTTVVLAGDMDAFQAATVYDEGAVGDTVADFFDWDIGW